MSKCLNVRDRNVARLIKDFGENDRGVYFQVYNRHNLLYHKLYDSLVIIF